MKAYLQVLLKFGGSVCGTRRRMAPGIDIFAEEIGGKLKLCKVNVEVTHDLLEENELTTEE